MILNRPGVRRQLVARVPCFPIGCLSDNGCGRARRP